MWRNARAHRHERRSWRAIRALHDQVVPSRMAVRPRRNPGRNRTDVAPSHLQRPCWRSLVVRRRTGGDGLRMACRDAREDRRRESEHRGSYSGDACGCRAFCGADFAPRAGDHAGSGRASVAQRPSVAARHRSGASAFAGTPRIGGASDRVRPVRAARHGWKTGRPVSNAASNSGRRCLHVGFNGLTQAGVSDHEGLARGCRGASPSAGVDGWRRDRRWRLAGPRTRAEFAYLFIAPRRPARAPRSDRSSGRPCDTCSTRVQVLARDTTLCRRARAMHPDRAGSCAGNLPVVEPGVAGRVRRIFQPVWRPAPADVFIDRDGMHCGRRRTAGRSPTKHSRPPLAARGDSYRGPSQRAFAIRRDWTDMGPEPLADDWIRISTKCCTSGRCGRVVADQRSRSVSERWTTRTGWSPRHLHQDARRTVGQPCRCSEWPPRTARRQAGGRGTTRRTFRCHIRSCV